MDKHLTMAEMEKEDTQMLRIGCGLLILSGIGGGYLAYLLWGWLS